MERELTAQSLVSVVAPVYNEAGNIAFFVHEAREALQALKLPCQYEMVLVNDGSLDGSGDVLDGLVREYPGEIRVVHLSRNFGHACAVSAGIDHAAGDIVITMDSDMQDDPAAFGPFVDWWRRGYDVVYAIRSSRTEPLLIRLLFWGFYRLLRWMANIRMPTDAGDFALLDKRVARHVASLPERNRYLPGLRAWVGFRQTGVPIARRARYDKKPRVGLRGLWTRAMNAVFAFSYVPIFVFRLAGAATLGLSGLLVVLALAARYAAPNILPAWTMPVIATTFFGGINLFGVGVVGEYVARIYDEVKGRPTYVVDRITGDHIQGRATSSAQEGYR